MNVKHLIEQETLSSKDVDQFNNLSITDFLQQLESVDAKILNRGYIGILKHYLLDLRNNKLDHRFAIWLADDLHNLPIFIANDFRGFSAKMFWEHLNSASGEYIRTKFIECLWSVASWIKHIDMNQAL